MIYSAHTFEITLNLDTNEFHKLKDKAYDKSRGKHQLYIKKGVYNDNFLADKGIKIEYHNNTYNKKIKFIVNPSRVLGGDDVKKLWRANKDNISKLFHKLENYIGDYFDSRYRLNDFKLTRIDFTVNIDVGNRKIVFAYIKVLRNIGKVKGFASKYSKNDDRIDTDLSFDLEGNSNGIEFTAYDKEAESQRKEAKGILRVEVRLTKQKTIRKYTDETVTSKQLKSLALNSEDIFLDTFTHIIPYGDFYKKKQAVKLIEDSILKKKHREKMLQLIGLIPAKKSLYLAQKEMNDRNVDKVMKMFAEMNLSPVTISKRHEIEHLKNMYSYLGK